MSEGQEDEDADISALIRVLGAKAVTGDLPVGLFDMMSHDRSKFQALAEAIANEDMKVIPVRWGGDEFHRLKKSIQEELRSTTSFSIDEETDYYDVFQWIHELQPTIGLFPLYRIEDRKRNWCIIKIGCQRRVCIAMLQSTAMRLVGRCELPILSINGTRPNINKDQFVTFIDELVHHNVDSTFFSFGSGHAAPRILAEVLGSNFSSLRYFVTNIVEYHTLPLVKAAQLAAAIELVDERIQAAASDEKTRRAAARSKPHAQGIAEGDHNQLAAEPDPIIPKKPIIDKLFISNAGSRRLREMGLPAAVQGLADQLKTSRDREYYFVVSDLGAQEFRHLLQEVEEYNYSVSAVTDQGSGRATPSAEELEQLVVLEIAHEIDIPIGIGISAPGLVRMSQLQVSERIHEKVMEWRRSLEDDKVTEILQTYGLELEELPEEVERRELVDALNDKVSKMRADAKELRRRNVEETKFVDPTTRRMDEIIGSRSDFTPEEVAFVSKKLEEALVADRDRDEKKYKECVAAIIKKLGGVDP